MALELPTNRQTLYVLDNAAQFIFILTTTSPMLMHIRIIYRIKFSLAHQLTVDE